MWRLVEDRARHGLFLEGAASNERFEHVASCRFISSIRRVVGRIVTYSAHKVVALGIAKWSLTLLEGLLLRVVMMIVEV